MLTSPMRKRFLLPVTQLLLLLAFALPSIRSAVRDNDQASIVAGAMQLTYHQISAFHSYLYEPDKQWGLYILLAGCLKLFPHVAPLLLCNCALLFFYTLGVVFAFYAASKDGLPLSTGLILCFCPALILYAPYLGSSQFSVAFLLMAYPFLRRRASPHFYMGVFLLFVGASIRVDAFFCLPAVYCAISARRTLRQAILDTKLWWLIVAMGVPIAVGRVAFPAGELADNLFFIPSYFIALYIFGIGLSWVLSALGFSGFWLNVAFRKTKWFLFYAISSVSLWLCLFYYAIQMYSARYFFLAFFSSFVMFSSCRGRLWIRTLCRQKNRVARFAVFGVTILGIAPWLFGLHMLSKHSGRLTFAHATKMPTADGIFPMGGYAAFAVQAAAHNAVIDHNQQTLLSARMIHYKPCPDGIVHVYSTGMADILQEAAEEQGLLSDQVGFTPERDCPFAYLELRGLLQNRGNVRVLMKYAMEWVTPSQALRPILLVDTSKPSNDVTAWVQTLLTAGKASDFSYHHLQGRDAKDTFTLESGMTAVVYTDDAACLPHEGIRMDLGTAGLYWAAIPAASKTRTISVCAHENGAWLPAEFPSFLQR